MSTGLLAGGIYGGVAGLYGSTAIVRATLNSNEFGYALIGAFFAIFACLMFFVPFSAAVRNFRIDLFGPKDIPIVFNRKTRKVYRFIQDLPVFPSSDNWREFVDSLTLIPRYWLTAFKPWPSMLLIEYDWDCLEAEYFEQTRPVGKVVTTLHVLQLVVKESPTSDRLIGAFTLASPLTIGRQPAMDLWEHIRRFMETNGPALSPGDKPSPPYPTTLLQAANTVTPNWPLAVAGSIATTWIMWRYGSPVSEALMGYKGFFVFAFALVCNFMTAVFIFNWLAHKFGQDVELPPELLADAGEPIDLQRMAADERRRR